MNGPLYDIALAMTLLFSAGIVVSYAYHLIAAKKRPRSREHFDSSDDQTFGF